MIAKIGIDLSMNSTGLVLDFINDDNVRITKFVQICPSIMKVSGDVQLVTYKRDYRKDNYSYEDLSAVNSATSLASCINKQMIKWSEIYNFDQIDARIEGSIMSSRFSKATANLNQLTVFNGTVKRMLLVHPLVVSIAVIGPTSLKKYFTGKGNAKKELMITKFIETFPMFDRSNKVKIDDIADAYALSIAQISDSMKYFKQN